MFFLDCQNLEANVELQDDNISMPICFSHCNSTAKLLIFLKSQLNLFTLASMKPKLTTTTTRNYKPAVLSSLCTNTFPRQLVPNDLILQFAALAKSLNINMEPKLTKHVATLLRLGVPSDEVYMFLKNCSEKSNEAKSKSL